MLSRVTGCMSHASTCLTRSIRSRWRSWRFLTRFRTTSRFPGTTSGTLTSSWRQSGTTLTLSGSTPSPRARSPTTSAPSSSREGTQPSRTSAQRSINRSSPNSRTPRFGVSASSSRPRESASTTSSSTRTLCRSSRRTKHQTPRKRDTTAS